jgi:hypothetical protein
MYMVNFARKQQQQQQQQQQWLVCADFFVSSAHGLRASVEAVAEYGTQKACITNSIRVHKMKIYRWVLGYFVWYLVPSKATARAIARHEIQTNLSYFDWRLRRENKAPR